MKNCKKPCGIWGHVWAVAGFGGELKRLGFKHRNWRSTIRIHPHEFTETEHPWKMESTISMVLCSIMMNATGLDHLIVVRIFFADITSSILLGYTPKYNQQNGVSRVPEHMGSFLRLCWVRTEGQLGTCLFGDKPWQKGKLMKFVYPTWSEESKAISPQTWSSIES